MTYEPTEEEIEAARIAYNQEDLRDQSAAIELAIIAAAKVRGDGWQPIDIAPKTGDYILLCDGGDGDDAYIGHWSIWGRDWEMDGEGFDCYPNYWMSLPEPPREGIKL